MSTMDLMSLWCRFLQVDILLRLIPSCCSLCCLNRPRLRHKFWHRNSVLDLGQGQGHLKTSKPLCYLKIIVDCDWKPLSNIQTAKLLWKRCMYTRITLITKGYTLPKLRENLNLRGISWIPEREFGHSMPCRYISIFLWFAFPAALWNCLYGSLSRHQKAVQSREPSSLRQCSPWLIAIAWLRFTKESSFWFLCWVKYLFRPHGQKR